MKAESLIWTVRTQAGRYNAPFPGFHLDDIFLLPCETDYGSQDGLHWQGVSRGSASAKGVLRVPNTRQRLFWVQRRHPTPDISVFGISFVKPKVLLGYGVSVDKSKMANRLNEARMALVQYYQNLCRGGRGWVLLFISMGWFLVLGGRIVYPALLPLISQDFTVNYTTIGGLIGVLWIAYALMQFPGGLLADRFGERAVLMLSLSLSLLGMTALVLSPVFGAFVIATAVLGIGNGLFGTTRITVLSDIYDGVETTAISISQAAGNVGNSVLPIIAGSLAATLGWRLGFGFMLPLFLVTAVGVWRTIPRRTSVENNPEERFFPMIRKVFTVVRMRPVIQVSTVHFMTLFLYQSLTGFLPTYLVEIKSISADVSAVLYGAFFAVAIVFQFLSGLLSDYYSKRATMSVFLVLCTPGYALLPFVNGFVPLVGVILLLSCMLGVFPPAHSYAVQALPSDLQGSGYGLIRTLYIALSATGPPLIGWLADIGLFDEAFFLLGAVAVLASINCALLPNLEPSK